MSAVRLGVLCWNQFTDWPALLDAGIRADRVGYDSLWTWDHMYPIIGDPHGPFFEGWLTLAAWAQATTHVRIGLMVGANPYRQPSLVAKMATTLDHISRGRAILGIGAGWFADEARDFGFEFGDGPPERLRWLAEALPVIRGMLDGTEPSAVGPHYKISHVRNLPAPVQHHLPICVGGNGRKVTLKLVARYADMCNVGENPEEVKELDPILRQHCEAVGRDERDIERTSLFGPIIIRDDRQEAHRVFRDAFERNRIDPTGRPWVDQPSGTPEDVAEHLAPYLELGYRHLIARVPAPYDEESMTRLITDVKPLLS